MNKQYDLSRFIEAHKEDYEMALNEIKQGRKRSHWMWYIFPQIQGLGLSSTSQYYAIKDSDEARAFLNDPYLSGHLLEISNVLLQLKTDNPTEVFGIPDDMKLRSSMTLFALVSDENSVFHKVLDKYFNGKYDYKTINIMKTGDK